MKKNYFTSVVSGMTLLLLTGVAETGYGQCLTSTGPTNNCSYGDAIDNLIINSVSATHAGCSGSGTGYTYFPTPVWNFTLGASYPIAITTGGGQYNQGVRIWIDMNGNGILETTESVYNDAASLSHTGTLIIPAVGVTTTTVRMRVMCTYNTVATAAQACNSNIGSYGETEDYEVQLSCSAPPQPTAASPVNICEGSTATLTVSSTPVGTLNWYTSATGGAPVGTGSTYTTPALTSSTSYYVSDSASGCPSNRTQVDVNVNPLPLVDLGPAISQCGGTATLDAGNPGDTYMWSTGETTQTISVSMSGAYTATVTTTAGCSASGSVSVTIDPFSDAGTISSSASSVCEGGMVTLSSAGTSPGTLMWYEFDGNNYNFLGNGNGYTTAALTAGMYNFVAMITSGSCPADTSASMLMVTADSVSNAGTASSSAGGTLCAGTDAIFSTAGSTGMIDWQVSTDGGMNWSSFGSGNPYDPGAPDNNDVGSYLFVAIVTNGACPSDTSNSFTIDVLASPVVMLGNDTAMCALVAMLDAGNAGSAYLWSTMDTTQMLTVTASGMYSVDVTNSSGCMSSDSIQLTLNDPAVVDLGPDAGFCESVTLDAGNAGAAYLWNTSDTTQMITVTSSGTYEVEVTAVNGCTGVDTIMVTINPNPTVTFTSSVDTICVTDPMFTLSGGSPAGGIYSGPGVSGGSFTPSMAGNGSQTITYAYTDVNGCSNSATQTIFVDPCTGVAEVMTVNEMQLYPNPTDGELNIVYMPGAVTHFVVTVLNTNGQLVYSEEVEQNGIYSKQIDLSHQAKGLYLVQIVNGNQVITGKVNVQ